MIVQNKMICCTGSNSSGCYGEATHHNDNVNLYYALVIGSKLLFWGKTVCFAIKDDKYSCTYPVFINQHILGKQTYTLRKKVLICAL